MEEFILRYGNPILIGLNLVCKILGMLIIIVVIIQRHTVLLPIGALTLVISSFGCLGAFYQNRIVLMMNAIALVIFLIAQLFAVLIFYPSYLHKRSLVQQQFNSLTILECVVISVAYFIQTIAAVGAFALAKVLHGRQREEIPYRRHDNENADAI